MTHKMHTLGCINYLISVHLKYTQHIELLTLSKIVYAYSILYVQCLFVYKTLNSITVGKVIISVI